MKKLNEARFLNEHLLRLEYSDLPPVLLGYYSYHNSFPKAPAFIILNNLFGDNDEVCRKVFLELYGTHMRTIENPPAKSFIEPKWSSLELGRAKVTFPVLSGPTVHDLTIKIR